jgi:transcriptional regulator GlxA family with amidase domain
LNRIRDALRDRSPKDALIKTVALSHGFRHLGQFSHDYGRLFGETPTETLRRRGATLEDDQLSMELGHPS